MKRNGKIRKRIVTQESVSKYCEWLYGCEKAVEPLNNTGTI